MKVETRFIRVIIIGRIFIEILLYFKISSGKNKLEINGKNETFAPERSLQFTKNIYAAVKNGICNSSGSACLNWKIGLYCSDL